MAKTTAYLSQDILLCVLEIFSDDCNTLSRCSLVNWEFNKAASGLLYKRIKLSPPFTRVLNLKSRSSLPPHESMHMFHSACIPRNAASVLELEISGYISNRPPPLNTLSTFLVDTLPLFPNLCSITFAPVTYHEDLFTQSLAVLTNVKSLRDLKVNMSCMGEVTAPILTRLRGLCNLTLQGPGRSILNIFPEWLEELSNTLTGLHLIDNCGSITPGVLKSFLPHVENTLREFSLGLSYSLTHEDVFSFVGRLHYLERLQLQYYLQFKKPSQLPVLGSLKYFAARNARMQTKREVIMFCKWVRMVLSASRIEHIRVICDDDDQSPFYGPNISFNNIIDHLAARHSTTLRILELKTAYLGGRALQLLFTTCLRLEEFHVSAGKGALEIFRKHSSCMVYLHTAEFNIRNIKRKRFKVDQLLFNQIFSDAPSSLRRLEINGVRAKAEWVSDAAKNVKFVVSIVRF